MSKIPNLPADPPRPIGQDSDGRPIYRREDVIRHAEALAIDGSAVDVMALRKARG